MKYLSIRSLLVAPFLLAGAAWAADVDGSQMISTPIWVQKPSIDDAVGYFPVEAKRAGVTAGAVRINCAIAETGRLRDCIVRSENPAQLGFGEAALKLSRHFQMAPESRDGVPTAGKRTEFLLMFAAP
jgi:protein TonB